MVHSSWPNHSLKAHIPMPSTFHHGEGIQTLPLSAVTHPHFLFSLFQEPQNHIPAHLPSSLAPTNQPRWDAVMIHMLLCSKFYITPPMAYGTFLPSAPSTFPAADSLLVTLGSWRRHRSSGSWWLSFVAICEQTEQDSTISTTTFPSPWPRWCFPWCLCPPDFHLSCRLFVTFRRILAHRCSP